MTAKQLPADATVHRAHMKAKKERTLHLSQSCCHGHGLRRWCWCADELWLQWDGRGAPRRCPCCACLPRLMVAVALPEHTSSHAMMKRTFEASAAVAAALAAATADDAAGVCKRARAHARVCVRIWLYLCLGRCGDGRGVD